ncbi:MAG: hypothetical protein IJ746_06135 [Ruminococcus sp.]|nr:hypothetical protein [Ruminococcus sp.]
MENDFVLTDELLAKLNRFTRRTVTAEEVYTFPVVLCDNETDRDGERFSDGALEQLAKLFVGKTGIFDHDPKSGNQTARIFDCEVVTDGDRLTTFGAPYKKLLAKAYMMRTESNLDLIKEIEGGIKKEVSVSCAAAEKRCSVCGRDRRSDPCGHIKGRVYEGRHCCDVLDGITDAYEWSFVAVPAQPEAGVTKRYTEEGEGEDKELRQRLAEQERINAAICDMLRREIISLSFLTKPMMAVETVKALTESLSFEQLLTMRDRLEKSLPKEKQEEKSSKGADTESFKC